MKPVFLIFALALTFSTSAYKVTPTSEERATIPRCFTPFISPNLSDITMALHRFFSKDKDLIYKVKTKEKVVALTLDDGPSYDPKFMPKVLDVLKKHNIKATFFALGSRLQKQQEKDILKRAFEEGHEVQIHGWDQKKLITDLDNQTILSHIDRTKEAIQEAVGEKFSPQYPWYFRPPVGITNERTTKLLIENQYPVVITTGIYGQYSLLRLQSHEPTTYVVPTVLKTLKPGAILTLHVGYYDGDKSERTWDSPCTASSLERLIPEIKKRGYRFLTMSEIMNFDKRNRGH